MSPYRLYGRKHLLLEFWKWYTPVPHFMTLLLVVTAIYDVHTTDT